MKIKDVIIKKLEYQKIPKTAYSFDGGRPVDCMCISKNEDTWEVYYSTENEKITYGVFYDEYEAYWFFYYLIMKKQNKNIKKLWF